VSTLAKVVSASVHNNGAANNALGANQLDQLVGDAALSIALAVGLEVAQVTDVALVILGSTVGLVVGIDCDSLASVCHSILGEYGMPTVRSSASAAVGVVTESVDVHATLSVGVVASNVP
jgi:hypothetical protein